MVGVEDGEHRRKSWTALALAAALTSGSAGSAWAASPLSARAALAGRRVLGLLSVVLGNQGHRW